MFHRLFFGLRRLGGLGRLRRLGRLCRLGRLWWRHAGWLVMDGSSGVHPDAIAFVIGWVKAVRPVFPVPPGGFWGGLVAL